MYNAGTDEENTYAGSFFNNVLPGARLAYSVWKAVSPVQVLKQVGLYTAVPLARKFGGDKIAQVVQYGVEGTAAFCDPTTFLIDKAIQKAAPHVANGIINGFNIKHPEAKAALRGITREAGSLAGSHFAATMKTTSGTKSTSHESNRTSRTTARAQSSGVRTIIRGAQRPVSTSITPRPHTAQPSINTSHHEVRHTNTNIRKVQVTKRDIVEESPKRITRSQANEVSMPRKRRREENSQDFSSRKYSGLVQERADVRPTKRQCIDHENLTFSRPATRSQSKHQTSVVSKMPSTRAHATKNVLSNTRKRRREESFQAPLSRSHSRTVNNDVDARPNKRQRIEDKNLISARPVTRGQAKQIKMASLHKDIPSKSSLQGSCIKNGKQRLKKMSSIVDKKRVNPSENRSYETRARVKKIASQQKTEAPSKQAENTHTKPSKRRENPPTKSVQYAKNARPKKNAQERTAEKPQEKVGSTSATYIPTPINAKTLMIDAQNIASNAGLPGNPFYIANKAALILAENRWGPDQSTWDQSLIQKWEGELYNRNFKEQVKYATDVLYETQSNAILTPLVNQYQQGQPLTAETQQALFGLDHGHATAQAYTQLTQQSIVNYGGTPMSSVQQEEFFVESYKIVSGPTSKQEENLVKLAKHTVEPQFSGETLNSFVENECYKNEQQAQSFAKGEWNATPEEYQREVPRIHSQGTEMLQFVENGAKSILGSGVGVQFTADGAQTTVTAGPLSNTSLIPIWESKPSTVHQGAGYSAIPAYPSAEVTPELPHHSETLPPVMVPATEPGINYGVLSTLPPSSTATEHKTSFNVGDLVSVATASTIQAVESVVPGFTNWATPKQVGVETVVDTYQRINSALETGHSVTESFVCGTAGGVVSAVTFGGGETLVAGASAALLSTGNVPGAALTFVAGSELVYNAAPEAGDLTQNACHQVFGMFKSKKSPGSRGSGFFDTPKTDAKPTTQADENNLTVPALLK